jgi:hypothetical protein
MSINGGKKTMKQYNVVIIAEYSVESKKREKQKAGRGPRRESLHERGLWRGALLFVLLL